MSVYSKCSITWNVALLSNFLRSLPDGSCGRRNAQFPLQTIYFFHLEQNVIVFLKPKNRLDSGNPESKPVQGLANILTHRPFLFQFKFRTKFEKKSPSQCWNPKAAAWQYSDAFAWFWRTKKHVFFSTLRRRFFLREVRKKKWDVP